MMLQPSSGEGRSERAERETVLDSGRCKNSTSGRGTLPALARYLAGRSSRKQDL